MAKKTKLKINAEVHYSVHNRKVFKAKMWLLTLALIVLLLCAGVMFTFGCVTWDPEAGLKPKPEVKYWWQALLVAFGAIVTLGSIVGYVLTCYFIFKRFYSTQAIYWKSPEFKKAKASALKVDLYRLKPKDLKWYKKMGYINAEQKRLAIEEQKKWKMACKAKKEKPNYAKSKA